MEALVHMCSLRNSYFERFARILDKTVLVKSFYEVADPYKGIIGV